MSKALNIERKNVMKNFKRILALMLAGLMIFAFAACANTNQGNSNIETTTPETTESSYKGETINVAAIKGPTGMGMINLMSDSAYNFTLTSDPTEVVSLITTGKVDIAACPLNVAANLYKKTGGQIKMLGINTLGVLYVVTNGVTVSGLKDLAGKTVYTTGQGATPEYIINHILDKNELKDEVKIEYLSEHSELATKLVANEVEIAILPEPFVTVATSKNKNVKVALSLTDEWNSVNPETELAMGCVIARSDFIEKNPEAVEKFISDNKNSVEYLNTNSYEGSEKLVEKGIVDSAVFAVEETGKKEQAAKTTKANEVIGRCNIVFVDGEKMQTIANANFETYFAANPASIGGEIPSKDLYYASK